MEEGKTKLFNPERRFNKMPAGGMPIRRAGPVFPVPGCAVPKNLPLNAATGLSGRTFRAGLRRKREILR